MKLVKLKINLLPKKELEGRALEKFLKWSLTFGRYIIVGTEIIVLLAFFSRFKLDRELTDLHEQINQKETIVKFNQEFEKETRNIQKQLKEIKGLEQNYDSVIKLLGFFESNIPKEVTLEKLSLSEERISLSGVSLSTSSFIDFLARIRTSEKFTQVNLEDLSKKGEEELKFTLAAEASKENLR